MGPSVNMEPSSIVIYLARPSLEAGELAEKRLSYGDSTGHGRVVVDTEAEPRQH